MTTPLSMHMDIIPIGSIGMATGLHYDSITTHVRMLVRVVSITSRTLSLHIPAAMSSLLPII